MTTAILGWGSLIWDPRGLPIQGDWKTDGPKLPVEFCRISASWPLTLVIDRGSNDVNVLHALYDGAYVSDAIENLAAREGCNVRHIGVIDKGSGIHKVSSRNVEIIPTIEEWMSVQGYDSVIWTDLPSNFKERTGRGFTVKNGLRFLNSLASADRERALQYIDNAPEQVNTSLRVAVELELR